MLGALQPQRLKFLRMCFVEVEMHDFKALCLSSDP